jgi:hypothetical protein
MRNTIELTVTRTLRLRRDAWARECGRVGLGSDNDAADAMSMDRTTVYRVVQRGGTPSAKFIAAALATFRSAKFEDLFEVVRIEERVA